MRNANSQEPEHTVIATARLPKSRYDAFKALAEREHRSISAQINHLVAQAIEPEPEDMAA